MDSKTNKAKYAEWIEEYQWDTCKIGRRDHGEFLANYLTSQRDGLVLNLNGGWGTGKTDFMRRMYVHFLQNGYPAIYIDAWESDFSKEPLMVIAGELLRQLQTLNENIGNLDSYAAVASKFAGFLKGAVIFGGSALTKGVFGDAEMGKIIAENLMGHQADQGMLELSKLHGEQVDAIKAIRNELSNLAEALKTNYRYKLPVVVLIDELDRCRPDYSIEMLEVVKHFFQTPNLVFVVASDTEQLCKSIAVVYGESFSADNYLRRFFNRTAKLPKPSFHQFVSGAFDELATDLPWVSHDPLSQDVGFDFIFASLCEEHQGKLQLRDLEQIIERIKSNYMQASALGRSNTEVHYINFTFMSMFAIHHHIDSTFVPSAHGNFGSSKQDSVLGSARFGRFVSFCMSMVFGFKEIDRIRVSEFVISQLYKCANSEAVSHQLRDAGGKLGKYFDDNKILYSPDQRVFFVKSGKWWLLDDYVKVINLSGSLE